MLKYTPKFGKKYYYISHCIGCEPNILKRQNCSSLDKTRIVEENCYKTKKQAEEALKRYEKEWLKTHNNLIRDERNK